MRRATPRWPSGWRSARSIWWCSPGSWSCSAPDFIRRFRGRILNVHPSLLPAFAGVGAIKQAVDYGVKVMGVTVHLVDEGVDSGPIVLQESFSLLPYPRGIEEIEERVHEVEHRLLPRAIRLIAEGRVRADSQNPRLLRIEDGHVE